MVILPLKRNILRLYLFSLGGIISTIFHFFHSVYMCVDYPRFHSTEEACRDAKSCVSRLVTQDCCP